MLDLPRPGERVYVWPHPGVRVQDGPLPISQGGRWLPSTGRSVIWDEYRYRQFLAGELHLTDPHNPSNTQATAVAPAEKA